MAGQKSNPVISEPKIDKKEKLTFSFEFYDRSGKYCLSKFEKTDIPLAIERLQQLNEKTLLEILRGKKVWHFHEVYWEMTTERGGFPSKKANEYSPFQFSLVGVNNQKARVYGALGGGIFYIVWFDLEHQVWPTFKKNT